LAVVRVLGAKAGALTMSAVVSGVGSSLRTRLEVLRLLRGPLVTDFTSQVRELVLIGSSSRGGSSMIAELLRRSSALLHLRAEFNPFLRLAGLGFPDSGAGSDRLDETHVRTADPQLRRLLDEELALDAGNLTEDVDTERFLLDAAWRFTVQWPEYDFELDAWLGIARRALVELRAARGWGPRELPDVNLFHMRLLDALAEGGIRVSAAYYDLPGAPPPGPGHHGAPGEVLVEEPPFVLTRGWQPASELDVRTKPLVIKTPSNAYRLGFLRALFPNARIRMVHLTRNPAAAINGLYDGWLHKGFHAHRVPEPLAIAGYATQVPDDRWWWKFDLPPGWRDYTNASLPQVCAFQWRSCHRAILDDLAVGGFDYLRLRFEDFIASPHSRADAAMRLCQWLGIPFDGVLRRAARQGIDPVVATAQPAPRRWLSRANIIRASLTDEDRAVAEELGYANEADWI
jgi:Sulfotransferase family